MYLYTYFLFNKLCRVLQQALLTVLMLLGFQNIIDVSPMLRTITLQDDA